MNIKELNEAIDKALCEKVEYINEWSIYYIDDVEPEEYFEEDEAGAWQRFEEVKDKVAQLVKKTYKIDGNEMDTVAEDVLYDYRDKSESVKQTKSSKESMKESKDETIYVLRHPDYPSVPDIACKSQTLIKYAEERRQEYIKTDDTISKNTITDVFAAKSFLEDNGFIIQAYVLY